MDTKELKNKTIRSIVALTGRQMISQVITLLTLIPLGLFLSPTALGTFIAVSSITPFFNFFVDLGLGSALIQKKTEPTETDLRIVFERQIIPSIIEQFVYSFVIVFLAIKGFEVKSYSWAFFISALVGLPI